jgi:hypothetical protein
MTRVLQYPRFGAFGGDIGGAITQWLGALYPHDVIGFPSPLRSSRATSGISRQPPRSRRTWMLATPMTSAIKATVKSCPLGPTQSPP